MLKNLFKNKSKKTEKTIDVEESLRKFNETIIANNQKMLDDWNRLVTAK